MKSQNLELPFLSSSSALVPKAADSSIDLSTVANSLLPQKSRGQLWLCLYFPNVSLALLESEKKRAQVVINEQNQGLCVYAANDIAREFGVTADMPLNSAYALCPTLTVFRRDKKAEADNILRIADWALQFSSHVSVVSVDKVLLEVKGSLDYFSGLTSILKKIDDSFSKKFSYPYQLAVTPTPMASQILCELSKKTVIERKEDSRSLVASISVNYLLKNSPRLFNKIQKTGVKTIQDLWRLPRDGLARRFGHELLTILDQLTGVIADPRLMYKSPLKYKKSIELPMETDSNKIIRWTVDQLFKNLEIFLRQSDTGIVQLNVFLKHQSNSSEIKLRLRQMSRSAVHLSTLFAERIERTRLAASVVEVSVFVDEILPFVTSSRSLFSQLNVDDDSSGVDADWENTLEQLQNRLGKKSVRYLKVQDEINPERAWSYQSSQSVIQQIGTEKRPLWLLPVSKLLKQHKNRPNYRGSLTFLFGPERIQTDWWHGKDKSIRRDYYIVASANAGYLWIYRELEKSKLKQNSQWYLHGFFG